MFDDFFKSTSLILDKFTQQMEDMQKFLLAQNQQKIESQNSSKIEIVEQKTNDLTPNQQPTTPNNDSLASNENSNEIQSPINFLTKLQKNEHQIDKEKKKEMKKLIKDAEHYIIEHLKQTEFPNGPKFIKEVSHQYPQIPKSIIQKLIKRNLK